VDRIADTMMHPPIQRWIPPEGGCGLPGTTSARMKAGPAVCSGDNRVMSDAFTEAWHTQLRRAGVPKRGIRSEQFI